MFKTMFFSKVHINMEKYSSYVEFVYTCTKQLLLGMVKDKWKAFLSIDELLLLCYLIHLWSKKNTKEMDFE